MRKAFIGGRVDVFHPVCINGYIYDVNSLYPAQMCKPMPVGPPVVSSDTNLDNYFGVVYAKIKTPMDIKCPPLPYRCDQKLFNPAGSFSGWYFSEELKFVRDTYGYEIDVIGGVKFEKGYDVFTDFITRYYDIKSKKDKNYYFILFPLGTIHYR